MKKTLLLLIILYGCSQSNSSEYLEKSKKENKIEDKINLCSKAIEIDSNYVDAYYERGKLYVTLAREVKIMIENGMQSAGADIAYFKKGVSDYQKILNLNPKESNAQLLIGFANLYQGDTITSCNEFRKAIELGNDEAKDALKKYCK